VLKRSLVFAYGLICYAVFFATYLHALGFVGNLLDPRLVLLLICGVPLLMVFTRGPGRRDVLGRRRASRAAQ
jgi:hypothetical protein